MNLIISKDNQDHAKRAPKKYYIILEQKEKMYLCEAGFFIPHKNLALSINSRMTAEIALTKMNELRKSQKHKTLCTLIQE